eukprot:751948-Amorphochlora_amoeboformis.AAC.1
MKCDLLIHFEQRDISLRGSCKELSVVDELDICHVSIAGHPSRFVFADRLLALGSLQRAVVDRAWSVKDNKAHPFSRHSDRDVGRSL